MQVKVQEKIRDNPNLASVVDQATKLLEDVVDSSDDPPTAHWSLSPDEQSRPLVELELSDFAGSVARQFSIDELSNSSHLEGLQRRVWRELLRVRFHKHRERLRQLVEKLEKEE